MSFAQEIKDFVAAYTAVSGALNESERTDIAARSAESEDAWRKSQIAKSEWEMGAEERENANILEFTRGGGGVSPLTIPTPSLGGTTGGGGGAVNMASGSYNAPALEQAFADTESFGGDWSAVGPDVKRKDGIHNAYGKYQVMDFNIPKWTTQYYGQQLSPEEFLANQDAQQAVFHGEMGRLFNQYGNVQDAASVWFTGVPYAQAVKEGRADQNMGVGQYVNQIASAYEKYTSSGKLAEATGEPVPEEGQGDAEAIPTETAPAPSARVQGIIDSGEWADQQPAPAIATPDEPVTATPAVATSPVATMPSYWDETQKAAAQGVDADLMKVVTRASEISGIPLGMNVTTVEGVETAPGLRTPEQQEVFRQKGWSKTNKSKHLKGRATDLVPLVNGKPVDPGSITDEQWTAINQAMTQASQELGIPVEWGGNWTGFVDKPHYQLPDTWKGTGVTNMANTATPVTPTTPDDLGTSDPEYRRMLEQRPGSGVFVPQTPGAVPLPSAAPTTAPPAVPAATEAAVPPPAIPETPAAARPRGFDPYSQTSGAMGAVAQAGHESLSPSAQATPERVKQAMTDRSTPKRNIFQAIFGFGRKALGAKDPAAVAANDNDPGGEAFAGAVGAAPLSLVQQMEDIIDPDRKMSPEVRQWEVMATMWNWHMQGGGGGSAESRARAEQRAAGATFSLYQAYKQISQKQLALAQAAASEGDDTDAIQRFLEAYNYIPDGDVMTATANEDGSFTLTLRNEETGKTTNKTVNSKDIISQITNITPDQFDSLVEEKILGKPPADTTVPGLEEAITEMPGAGGGPRPSGTEEAVPTVPPAPTGSAGADELGPEVPAGMEEGPDAIPEGIEPAPPTTEAIPPDARTPAPMPTGPAPATSGGATPAPMPTPPPTTVTPPAPAPAETGDVSGGGDGSVVPAATPASADKPRQPMSWDQFALWRNGYDQKMWPQLTDDWDRQNKIWTDWETAQAKAVSPEARQLMADFYTRLAETSPDAEFDIPEEYFGPIATETDVVNSMRAAAQLHNDERARRITESATLADRTRENMERIEAEQSGELRQRLSRGLREPPVDYGTGARVAGQLAEDVTGVVSNIGGAVSYPVQGQELQPEAVRTIPRAADALSTRGESSDYTEFVTDVDTQNREIRQRNKERFETEPPPLDATDAAAIITASTPEQTAWLESVKLNKADDPVTMRTIGYLEDSIKRKSLQKPIDSAVINMVQHGGKDGMTPEIAVRTALSMITVPSDDPYTPHYTAAYSETQPGMIDVTFPNGNVVAMPENTYNTLDTARREMAADFINAERQGLIDAQGQLIRDANIERLKQEALGRSDASVAPMTPEETEAPPTAPNEFDPNAPTMTDIFAIPEEEEQ